MWRTMQVSVSVCVAVLCACGGADKPSGPDSIYADYTLTAVNGSAIPALIAETTSSHTVINSASIRLSANGTFVDSRAMVLTDAQGNHALNNSRYGSFALAGTALTLNYQDLSGVSVAAALSGRVITKAEGAYTLTFTR